MICYESVVKQEKNFLASMISRILALVNQKKVEITNQQMEYLELWILKAKEIQPFVKQLLIAFLRESHNLTKQLYLSFSYPKNDEYLGVYNYIVQLDNHSNLKNDINEVMKRFGSNFRFNMSEDNRFGFVLFLNETNSNSVKFSIPLSYVRTINIENK